MIDNAPTNPNDKASEALIVDIIKKTLIVKGMNILVKWDKLLTDNEYFL